MLNKRKNITDIFIDIFIYTMIIIFPLYYNNYYADIVTCKYKLFTIIVPIGLIFGIITVLADKGKLKRSYKTDNIVILIEVSTFLSFLLSDYRENAVHGAGGRYFGVITIFSLGIIYFVITRVYKSGEGVYIATGISAIFTGGLAIFNSIGFDPLGFYRELPENMRVMYISTIGHVDVFTQLMGLFLPLLLCKLIDVKNEVNEEDEADEENNVNKENEANKANGLKKILKRIFYLFTSLIAGIALICCGCNAGILGLLFAYGLTVVFKNHKDAEIIYLLHFLSVLSISKLCLGIAEMRNYEGQKCEAGELILDSRVLIALTIIAFLYLIVYLKLNYNSITKKVITVIVVCIIPIYAVLLLYFSCINKQFDLGAFEGILRFNDNYGSYRGFIWRLITEEFGKLDLIHKFFGIGPDVLLQFLSESNLDKMTEVTGVVYDNAHNEFLQYLITGGVVGLALYIILLVNTFRTFAEKKNYNYIVMMMVYLIVSFFGINQVITTTLFALYVSIGLAEGTEVD